jgi:hypothetical protein
VGSFRRGSESGSPGLGAPDLQTCGKPEAEISSLHDLKAPSPSQAERKEVTVLLNLCRLNEAFGVAEECPEKACPFWEPGGAVLAGRCTFEGLDLSGRRDLAAYLLQLRAGLRTAETNEEREMRRLFYRRLNAGRGD